MERQESLRSLETELQQLVSVSKTNLPSTSTQLETISRIKSITTFLVNNSPGVLADDSVLNIIVLCDDILLCFKNEYSRSVKILMNLLEVLSTKGPSQIVRKCLRTIHSMLVSLCQGNQIHDTTKSLYLFDGLKYSDTAFKNDTEHVIIRYFSVSLSFISKHPDHFTTAEVMRFTKADTPFFCWLYMTPKETSQPYMKHISYAFKALSKSAKTETQTLRYLIRCFVCLVIEAENVEMLKNTIISDIQEKTQHLSSYEMNTIRDDVYLVIKAFQMDGPRSQQIEVLRNVFHIHQPLSEFKIDNLTDLPKLLDNLQLSDYATLSRFLNDHTDEKLLESFLFRKGLYKVLKSVDMSQNSSQVLVISILAYIERVSSKRSCISITGVLHILDYITIRIKDMSPDGNEPFLNSCLQHLLHIFEKRQQVKRMRNLSSLYYNFATTLYHEHRQTCVSFWNNSLEIETDLKNHHHQYNDHLLKKSVRICNFLIELAKFDEASKVLSACFFDQSYNAELSINDLFVCLKGKNGNFIKLACKLILKSQNVKFLWALSKNQGLITCVSLEVCTMLTQMLEAKAQPLITKIILMLKVNLTDIGLFLLFISKISFIIKFSITFKSIGNLKILKESAAYDLRGVIKAHLYLLQAYSSPRNMEKLLFNAYRCITTREYKADYTPCDYEVDVLATVSRVFQYHNLMKFMIAPLENSLKECAFTKSQRQKVLFELSSCYNRLGLKKHASSLDIKPGCDPSSKIMWALHNCMLIEIDSHIFMPQDMIKKSYNKLMSAIVNDNDFTFKGKRDSSLIIDLIFLLARVSHLHALLSMNFGHPSASVLSFKRSIRILQSVLKNFLLPNSSLSLTLNEKMLTTCEYSMRSVEGYNSLLNCLFHYGLGKEIDYFIKEYWSFVKTQPSKYVHCSCLIDSALFEALRGRYKEAADCLSAGTSEYKTLTFVAENQLHILAVQQMVYHQSQNSDDFTNAAERYDSIMDNLLTFKEHPLNSCDDSEHRDEHLYIQDQEYLRSEWSRCQRIRSLDNMVVMNLHAIMSNDTITKSQYELQKIDEEIQKKVGSQTLEFLISYPLYCSTENRASLSSYASSFNKRILAMNSFQICSQMSSRERKSMLETLTTVFNCLIPFQKEADLHAIYQFLSISYDQNRFEPFIIEKELACQIEDPKTVLPPRLMDTNFDIKLLSNSRKLCDLLPQNWAVISIDTHNTKDFLTLTKYLAGGSSPIMVNIPLTKAENGSRNMFSVKFAIHEFEDIIQKSDATTSYRVTSSIKTKQDRVAWWTARRSLDNDLENLLMRIETVWFGGLSSLFGDFIFDVKILKAFKSSFVSIIADNVTKAGSEHTVIEKLRSIGPELFSLFLQLAMNPSDNYMEDLLFYFLDAITGLGREFDYRRLDMDSLYTDIIALCNKTISDIDCESLRHIEHTVLVLSDGCVKLPWESIPSLRGKSVSRMPSITQLVEYLKNFGTLISEGVSADNGYYILNPGGDLVKTESRFKEKFEVMSGWSGITGKRPSEETILNALSKKELYFYAGHGGGEQYIRSKSIQKFEKLPPCLLLGCSSGSLHVSGICHSYGTVYNYIIGKSPMILANLWDVTDKDIDRFTLNTLEKWGLFVDYDSIDIVDSLDNFENDNNHTLCECVAKSRNSCKLKYLNGAAPVVYGLPLKLKLNS